LGQYDQVRTAEAGCVVCVIANTATAKAAPVSIRIFMFASPLRARGPARKVR
jgi:hypothetical protein